MVRWCRLRVCDGMDIDDALQEASIACLDAIRGYNQAVGTKFSTYLKTCVFHRLGRWRARDGNRPIDQEHAEDLEAAPEREPFDPGRLPEVLADLDPIARQVIALRFGLEGGEPLEAGSVAHRLRMSVEAVAAIELAAMVEMRNRLG